MAVLDLVPGGVAYDLRIVEVHTLHDVGALRGEAVRPIGSAEIRLEPWRFMQVTTEAQFRAAALEDPGSDVEAQFIESGGVLYPSDFHSLSLATAYYHFETARTYALARGMSRDSLREVPFYYFPKVTDDPSRGWWADNAGWSPVLRSFLVYPFDEFQDIPLAVNQGVIAHEYGHGIFNAEVHGGSWLPSYAERWGPLTAGAIMMNSIEEGFADAWALGVSGDLGYVERSLGPVEALARDPTFDPKRHCYSQASFEAEIAEKRKLSLSEREAHWSGRKYRIGTMWASALVRAGEQPGTDYDRVMDALFASYRAVGDKSLARLTASDRDGETFGNFAAIGSAIIAGAPDDPTRRALCQVLMGRFSIPAAELGACDGVLPGGGCR